MKPIVTSIAFCAATIFACSSTNSLADRGRGHHEDDGECSSSSVSSSSSSPSSLGNEQGEDESSSSSSSSVSSSSSAASQGRVKIRIRTDKKIESSVKSKIPNDVLDLPTVADARASVIELTVTRALAPIAVCTFQKQVSRKEAEFELSVENKSQRRRRGVTAACDIDPALAGVQRGFPALQSGDEYSIVLTNNAGVHQLKSGVIE